MAGCELIIEAIAERMDWKNDLTQDRAAISANAITVRLQHLRTVDRAGWPEALPRFVPIFAASASSARRYMRLVEIIATRDDRPGDAGCA